VGESAYPEERYICTQVLFAQLFPGSSKSLTSMCDRLVLDSSERNDRHGALLDADMTIARIWRGHTLGVCAEDYAS
jgi:DNA polymerase III epsilon subunit-like protein